MITHTTAFKAFRDLGQAHLDFVVLACHAIPALRSELMTPDALVKTNPDHFKAGSNSAAQLLAYSSGYQEELARTALITVFSYFEAYVKDALREIIKFHGGEAKIKEMARDRAKIYFNIIPEKLDMSRRKLQDRPHSSKREKYEKHARLLDKAGYRFPTDLLMHFGAVQLLKKVKGKQGLKAYEIPEMLEDVLLFPLTTTDKQTYEDIREKRNQVAHGTGVTITLRQALTWSSALHRIAAAIDAHIVKHFLVIQPA